ncbi:MoxR family ATPase [Bdellovibrionota bacterium FG-2]
MKRVPQIPELIGRETELTRLRACLEAGRNVLIEGPVGVGKTHLALAVCHELGVPVFRIDGDARYSEHKLSGWFDPPLVVKNGFSKDAFIPGPLVEAMKAGGVLFINELNRLPEGVQNILLPAVDEHLVVIPRFGEVRAKPGFLVVATQNPKEFVATSHLSEAILDRFELVVLNYQSEKDEREIVRVQLKKTTAVKKAPAQTLEMIVGYSVSLVRLTRTHAQIRRGGSVRAALALAELWAVLLKKGCAFEVGFFEAALLSLPNRIEFEHHAEGSGEAKVEFEVFLREAIQKILAGSGVSGQENQKKKR